MLLKPSQNELTDTVLGDIDGHSCIAKAAWYFDKFRLPLDLSS